MNIECFFKLRFLLIAKAIFVLCFFGGCGATPTKDGDSQRPRFARPIETILDGRWEGTLKMRGPLTTPDTTKSPDAEDVQLRVIIDGMAAQIFLFDSGKWIEVMPGSFKVIRYRSNATAIAMNASNAGGGLKVGLFL